jgi:hypothetical protein
VAVGLPGPSVHVVFQSGDETERKKIHFISFFVEQTEVGTNLPNHNKLSIPCDEIQG